MQLSRRSFLALGVAAATVPVVAHAQAAPVLQPFEQALGNAIGRWTGRVAAVGVAANDNAVRVAVANELTWAGRAAPVLKTFGKYMGAVSVGLVLFEVAKYVVADTNLAGIFARNDNGGTMPASYDTIIGNTPRNGVVTYTTTGGAKRTFWVTWEHPPYASSKYLPTWEFRNQRNSPDMDAFGDKGVVWERVDGASTVWVPPNQDYETVKAAVAAVDPATHIDAASAAGVLKQALTTARNALADKTGFPDPAIYPPTAADIDATLWTAPLLVGNTAADRDVNLGTSAQTGPDAGDDPGSQPFDPGPAPTPLAIPNLGDLPWPTWNLSPTPPVTASCSDPTLAIPFGGALGIPDQTLTATGWCSYGQSAAVFVRPFMLGVVTLGCVIIALRDK